ncbi:Oidioi.mRNA.OKI2018_I69.PAR.g9242.t1.cds [Oikopleura dioica]|uniref:Oidioi.mRNA.OKI2018_I69.PAR.g9242.t1.cds n=1 Tax=Oikopleura dioica TaxID=34765 RepID=A0ABN7RS97_OIKDI|nr:Oidioi.mRNA.OKI2018_I69.PAR.g9242.t1.cds [Oikopleura dioica]
MPLEFEQIAQLIAMQKRVQVKLEDDAKKDTTMKWYSYLILLLMYIVYLAIGAMVFQKFEQPNEKNKCIEAKEKVRTKINQFGDDYFYTLGLNLKFCRGVNEFLDTQSAGVQQGMGF